MLNYGSSIVYIVKIIGLKYIHQEMISKAWSGHNVYK